jgi:hypothetical protein
MMFFSQRKGLKPVSTIIQRDSINDELRNKLWNILDMVIWKRNDFLRYSSGLQSMENFSTILWHSYFKKAIDTRPPSSYEQLDVIRKYYFSCLWHEVYDFLEFTLRYFKDTIITDLINQTLEQELSAYRFVGDVFTDITNEQEILMLEEAISDKDFPGVSAHLIRALELLSDRKNPDYRNSIKESISAVESLARIITKKPQATLGQAINFIELKNRIHPALRDAFSKLYGYTSDQGGIRHSMLDEPDLTVADAKYFLLSCTSFINYLKSKL